MRNSQQTWKTRPRQSTKPILWCVVYIMIYICGSRDIHVQLIIDLGILIRKIKDPYQIRNFYFPIFPAAFLWATNLSPSLSKLPIGWIWELRNSGVFLKRRKWKRPYGNPGNTYLYRLSLWSLSDCFEKYFWLLPPALSANHILISPFPSFPFFYLYPWFFFPHNLTEFLSRVLLSLVLSLFPAETLESSPCETLIIDSIESRVLLHIHCLPRSG